MGRTQDSASPIPDETSLARRDAWERSQDFGVEGFPAVDLKMKRERASSPEETREPASTLNPKPRKGVKPSALVKHVVKMPWQSIALV